MPITKVQGSNPFNILPHQSPCPKQGFRCLLSSECSNCCSAEKKKIDVKLTYDEKKLSHQLSEMKKKNTLLSDKLDLDYLEILYREKLKFGKKEEVIIKLN